MIQKMGMAVALAVLVVSASPLAAGSGNQCSPAGTWYGGSEPSKYLMTIVPKGGNSYSVTGQGAYTLEDLGVEANTSYSGEMVKIGPKKYEARLITLISHQAAPPPTDPNALEIDAARGIMEMTSCNEMTSTIDYFVAYLGWGAEPFVDPFDLDLLLILNGGQPIVETYRRISMD